MNEITAAIKKKAEEKYPHTYHTDRTYLDDKYFGIKQSAYTCGGEDAIGFMLKFVEWANERFTWVEANMWDGDNDETYTTEQLLLKYIENNKL